MTYTEQLEREAQESRSQLAGTLDELRACITPGHVVDQVADYVGDGDAGIFFRTLKRQVARNPLPATLIGAGVIWLMMSNGKSNGSGFDGGRLRAASRDTSEAVRDAGDAVREAAHRTTQRADEALSKAEATARTAKDATYDTVVETGTRVADSTARATEAVRERARTIGRTASTTSRSTLDFCREQPLVLAGLGLALGAALGALLPSTEMEDRLLGEDSDEAKSRVGDLVAAAFENSKGDGDDAGSRDTDASASPVP